MKKLLLVVIIIFITASCHDDTIGTATSADYLVQVVGRGTDCGDLFLVDVLTNRELFYQEVQSRNINRAYVLNLNEECKVSGLLLQVKLQSATFTSELVACTTLGPAYPQVKLTTIIDPINCQETPGDPACGCYKIYKPVCGCNGVTYGNDCMAECKGITNFTEGACP